MSAQTVAPGICPSQLYLPDSPKSSFRLIFSDITKSTYSIQSVQSRQRFEPERAVHRRKRCIARGIGVVVGRQLMLVLLSRNAKKSDVVANYEAGAALWTDLPRGRPRGPLGYGTTRHRKRSRRLFPPWLSISPKLSMTEKLPLEQRKTTASPGRLIDTWRQFGRTRWRSAW